MGEKAAREGGGGACPLTEGMPPPRPAATSLLRGQADLRVPAAHALSPMRAPWRKATRQTLKRAHEAARSGSARTARMRTSSPSSSSEAIASAGAGTAEAIASSAAPATAPAAPEGGAAAGAGTKAAGRHAARARAASTRVGRADRERTAAMACRSGRGRRAAAPRRNRRRGGTFVNRRQRYHGPSPREGRTARSKTLGRNGWRRGAGGEAEGSRPAAAGDLHL
ncbi:unnamed protein product, partial [Prorocentrum cordatum]